MEAEFFAAVLSATATLTVCLINNRAQEKRAAEQHEKTISLIEYRLKQIEKKQDKHNNVIERTYELEKNQGILEEQIKALKEDFEASRD